MFSLVEIEEKKNRREEKKIIKLIKTCDIRNKKHKKKCFFKLSKTRNSVKHFCKILCSSDEKELLIDIQQKLITKSPRIVIKKEVDFACQENIKSFTSPEKCNVTLNLSNQNSISKNLLNINNDIECLENVLATPENYYTDSNANIILNSNLDKNEASIDILDDNFIQNCTLEANALQSDLLLNSNIKIDINEDEIHAAQINRIEQNKQKKPKIIKNEVFRSKIKIVQNNLNLSNNDLPNTSLSEASVTKDLSVVTGCDENKTNDIQDNVMEDNDIKDDDSDFVPSIQSEESNDISENDEKYNIKNNEISEIINQSKENNTSSHNESSSKCLNKSRGYKLSNSSLEGDLMTRKRTNYCKDDDLFVEISRGPKGDKKSNFCFYCNTMQTKIARHLELKHSNEKDVVKFLSLPKGSYERRMMIGNCRKKGNYKFNTHADINNGFMIVVRRPNNKAKQNGSNFLPCPKCGGHYARNNLRHHFRFCAKKKDTSRYVLQLAQSAAKSVHNRACTKLRTRIIPILKQDDIRNIIRYDLLIILYGNHLCQRHRLEHQDDYIRSQLRLLGRYLKVLKQIEPQIKELQMLFDPKYYDTAIKAVNTIANYNEETELYEAPFNASSLGTMLKKLCKILISEHIKEHNSEKQKLTEDFQKILEAEYGHIVNKTVVETVSKRNRQKKVELPRSSDIAKFNKYLEMKRMSNMEILQNDFSFKAWRSLAETILIIIQIFNRRRAGEIERTLINDYKNSIKVTDNDEEYKKLPASDKEAAKKYIRFTVRGKLNRTVPVLLNSKMIESIETILKYRNMAGVSSKNPYLFGIPNSNKKKSKHLKACKLMRELSAVCGVENDKALRGTNLRKHIATKCLSLNLSENEVSHVANFMGHHQDIHKQIYRQPVAKIDILDMSKILERAGNTSAHNTTDSSARDNTTDTSINNLSEIQEMEYSCNSNENEKLETTENEDSENEIFLPFTDTTDENILRERKARKRKYSKDISSKSEERLKKMRFTHSDEKIVRARWTIEEKEMALSLFGEYIDKNVLPPFNEVTSKTRNTILKNRSSAAIKTWLHNQMRKRKQA